MRTQAQNVQYEISFCICRLLQLSNLSVMPIDKAGESNEGTGGRVEKGKLHQNLVFLYGIFKANFYCIKAEGGWALSRWALGRWGVVGCQPSLGG